MSKTTPVININAAEVVKAAELLRRYFTELNFSHSYSFRDDFGTLHTRTFRTADPRTLSDLDRFFTLDRGRAGGFIALTLFAAGLIRCLFCEAAEETGAEAFGDIKQLADAFEAAILPAIFETMPASSFYAFIADHSVEFANV